MNFKDEYKREINELAPNETAERIREGVMKRLAEQSETPDAKPKRTPLLLGRLAAIGAAACLVIGVTAAISVGGLKLIGNKNFTGNAIPDNAAPGIEGSDMNGSMQPVGGGALSEANNFDQQAPANIAPISIAFSGSDCTVIFKGTEHRYSTKEYGSDGTNMIGSDNAPGISDIFSGTDFFSARSEEDGRSFYIAFDGDELMVYDTEYNLLDIYIRVK